MSIKPIDKTSIHRITSGQVVIDLQTAVKELVENSLDAGATNLEVRFKQYGLATIEVIDNGGGISEENYEGLALKNHTSKLSSFADLTTVTTFGFRGEALSSLCALCESVVVSTATQPPMGVTLEMESSGKIRHKGKVARQRGTTITLTNLFSTLPVRRKEFERNAKREFGKALTLLNAYALGPCSSRNGVRLTVSNQADKGQKSVQIRTPGTPSLRDAVSSLWGPKALDTIVTLDLSFPVERDKMALKRTSEPDNAPIQVVVRGLVSKFAVGCGRTGTDRQFFYVNGRPCNLSKIQKSFNEVYRSFNATQSPFIIADFILPTDSCDINVSPDKRSILLHHETNLIAALKTTLETTFASSRSTYDVEATKQKTMTQTLLPAAQSLSKCSSKTVDVVEGGDEGLRTPQALSKRSSVKAVVVESDEETEVPDAPSKGGDTDIEMQPIAHPSKDVATPKNSDPVEVAPAPICRTATSSSVVLTNIASATLVESPGHQTGDSPFLAPEPIIAKPKPKRDSGSSGAAPVIDPPSPRPPSSSCSSQSLIEDVVVTLDSSRASWQHKLQLARKLPDEPENEPAPQPSDEGHVRARKKRRSEPDPDDEFREEPDPPVPSAQVKSARQSLRTMLVGFSGPGSQRQRPPEVEMNEEGDEDELESSGDDERAVPPPPRRPANPKNARRDSADKGDDVEMQVDSDDLDDTPPIDVLTNSKKARRDIGGGDVEMEVDSDALDMGPPAALDSPTNVVDIAAPSNIDHGEEDVTIIQPAAVTPAHKPPILHANSTVIDLTDEDMFDSSELSALAFDASSSVTPALDEVVSRPEVIRTSDDGRGDLSLRFNVSKISNSWNRLRESLAAASARRGLEDAPSKTLLDAGITDEVSDDVATEALARTISKDDFGSMEILGQFNLGFVITRRRKDKNDESGAAMDDLFIVDQHAADEKYNFETLQQTTRIKSQKLFRSQPLELTAGDELLALENLDVLRQNGFEVEAGSDHAAGVGPRLSLTAQPVSKDTVFDMKDLEELIHRMRDQPTGQMVRCSKARAMFAMRACRKSVMIGMPLTTGQMTAVVRHMGTMDQPWNCPHGRPTMRHLADILGEQDRRGVNWAGFADG